MSTLGLRVATANLRCRVPDVLDDDPDNWRRRLPAMATVLQGLGAAVVGTQEGHRVQVDGLLAALPGWASVGEGREPGDDAETCALLFDTSCLRLRQWRQFWLSPTPEVPASMGWGAGCTRIATVARFVVLDEGREVCIANTHLDHVSDEARLEGMRVLLAGLGELGELPLVLTGDFNCSAGSDPWRLALEHGLRDTVEAADRLGTLVDTFHDYAEPCASEPLERIDWVLVSPEWSVDSCEVVTDRPGGVWGSDHWPVVADLHL